MIILETLEDRLAYMIGKLVMEREALAAELEKLKAQAEPEKKP